MAAAGRWTVLALAVLPPALAQAAEPVLCGTRWLAEQRASGALPPLPAARPAAPRQAEPPPVAVGMEQLFPVYGSVTPVRATCRYAGTRCFVFVENAQWDTEGGPVLQSDVDKLATLFEDSTPADPDRGIYDLVVEAFGEAEDVDGYEQIFLLVLDLADPHLVGFFDPAVSVHDLPEYRRDLLYLSQYHLRRQAYLARGTLAHELQHLLHWGSDRNEENWVNEGLSGYAEAVAGFPEADPAAVPAFLDRPETSLTTWKGAPRNYGATYLFAAYLAERHGPDLIRALVSEPANGIAGVDGALEGIGSGDRFVDAWSGWVAANYASDDPRLAYGALGGRRVRTFDYDALPQQRLPFALTDAWGTVNVLFRTPGDLAIDFEGEEGAGFLAWTYAMSPGASRLEEVSLTGNRGQAQAAGIDSLVLIVGGTSPRGGGFELSAEVSTDLAAAGLPGAGPASSTLGEAYPNPFNAEVRIPYSLAGQGPVELSVLSLGGQRLRALVTGPRPVGRHEAVWDGRDDAGRRVASGTYLVRLRTGGSTSAGRLALIR